MDNNLPKLSEPLELIAPVPIEWEISPDFNGKPFCNAGTVCEVGSFT